MKSLKKIQDKKFACITKALNDDSITIEEANGYAAALEHAEALNDMVTTTRSRLEVLEEKASSFMKRLHSEPEESYSDQGLERELFYSMMALDEFSKSLRVQICDLWKEMFQHLLES